MQSVELLLDAATEEHVLAQWRALADADLPSQAHHTGATNRPHVTLAAVGALDEPAERRLAAAVRQARAAGGGLPLPVRLGPPVVLGGRRHVLARLVVATPGLLALHAAVRAALHDGTAEEDDEGDLLAPGAWTPHVTLARGLGGEQLAHALGVLRAAARDAVGPGTDAAPGVPRPGAAVAVRRFDGTEKVTWLVDGGDPLGRTPAARPVAGGPEDEEPDAAGAAG